MDNAYDIEKAFKRIEHELIDSMMRNLDHHRAMETAEGFNWSQWQVEQLAALERYKKANVKTFSKTFDDINKSIPAMIRAQRAAGNAAQEIEILKAIEKGFKAKKALQSGFFKVNTRKINALIKATTDDVKNAERSILRYSNDQYRKVIFNAQLYATSGTTYEQAVDMATKDFLRAGLRCVEYKNGARHTVSDYASMAVQTANKRAYLTGEGEKRAEWGIATVKIHKRLGPCPLCLPFVGKVMIDDVWSSGSSDGKHMLMSSAMSAGLYHPRCKDAHSTYFPGITPDDDRPSKQEKQEMFDNYNAEQKSAYAKRQAESYGRMAEYSLDKDNQKKYAARSEEWEANVNERGSSNSVCVGSNVVDLSRMRSIEFNKKFSHITSNTSVNESIRKYAKAMLTHRNGTDFEDLYIIDSLNGSLKLSKVNCNRPLGIELNGGDIDYIRNLKSKIGIHNHPSNLLPTGSDFVTAGYRKYDFGIVVTHDLRIYKYKAGKRPFPASYIDNKVDKYMQKPYNLPIIEAQKRALTEISREGLIVWKEMI